MLVGLCSPSFLLVCFSLLILTWYTKFFSLNTGGLIRKCVKALDDRILFCRGFTLPSGNQLVQGLPLSASVQLRTELIWGLISGFVRLGLPLFDHSSQTVVLQWSQLRAQGHSWVLYPWQILHLNLLDVLPCIAKNLADISERRLPLARFTSCIYIVSWILAPRVMTAWEVRNCDFCFLALWDALQLCWLLHLLVGDLGQALCLSPYVKCPNGKCDGQTLKSCKDLS